MSLLHLDPDLCFSSVPLACTVTEFSQQTWAQRGSSLTSIRETGALRSTPGTSEKSIIGRRQRRPASWSSTGEAWPSPSNPGCHTGTPRSHWSTISTWLLQSPLCSGSPQSLLQSSLHSVSPQSPLQSPLRSGSPQRPLQSPLCSVSPLSPLQSPLLSGSPQSLLQSPLRSGSPPSPLQSPLRSGSPPSLLQSTLRSGSP